MIWFTADTHFGHTNVVKACYRPYDSVENMDIALMGNWNTRIGVKDEVYHLGDFCWSHKVSVWEYYRKRLNGKIHLIRGNHDLSKKKIEHLFESVENLHVLRYNKQRIMLCHYAMRVWSMSHYDMPQLYGHSHGTIKPIGKQMDVGVDANGYFPINIEQVFKKLLSKPENPMIDHHKRRPKNPHQR